MRSTARSRIRGFTVWDRDLAYARATPSSSCPSTSSWSRRGRLSRAIEHLLRQRAKRLGCHISWTEAKEGLANDLQLRFPDDGTVFDHRREHAVVASEDPPAIRHLFT